VTPGSRPVRANPSAHPIKSILKDRGISQAALADQLGFFRLTVHKMINGKEGATPRFRKGAVELLGLPEDVLFSTPVRKHSTCPTCTCAERVPA
jgi:transcriptional regulator with XRE-family HTH domain